MQYRQYKTLDGGTVTAIAPTTPTDLIKLEVRFLDGDLDAEHSLGDQDIDLEDED